MGLQFFNIYRTARVKSVSRVNNTNRTTTLKKKSRRRQVVHSLTAANLAFLRSLTLFNMDVMYLDVTAGYTDDCRITQIKYHSFLPYSTSALSNNDEVRIALHNTESYTLPYESYIYIEGTIIKPADIT